MKFTIAYSGWTEVTVEAANAEEAERRFEQDGLSSLNDWIVEEVLPSGEPVGE